MADHLINNQINIPEVRLIDSNGNQKGIVSTKTALIEAMDAELDLVLISPNANPPVAKIMDYGKFRFDEAKRERLNKQNNKVIETKEVQISLSIDKADLDRKAKNVRKFLEDGHKVKVTLRLKGREITRPERATEMIQEFVERFSDIGTFDKGSEIVGRTVSRMVSPIKKKII